jgi:hypothetical protein
MMKANTPSTATGTKTTTQAVLEIMVNTLTELGWSPQSIAQAVSDFQAEVSNH